MEIEHKYSEYLSNRLNKLIDSTKNGYKKTLKGWYIFKNVNKSIFYRSSWELKVLENIDDMILTKDIIRVNEPKSIIYFYEYNRHYYPDIEIEFNNNKIIIFEIKPYRKLNDILNIKKFEEAYKQIENFVILTENEIFSDELKNIILKNK